MDAKNDASLHKLRTDQVGGLPRPAWLRDIQLQFNDGLISEEQLADAHVRAVEGLLRRQELVGLPVLTDGESTRTSFQESFGGAVSGFDATPEAYRRLSSSQTGGTAPTRAPSGMAGPGPAVLHRRPTVERLQLTRNVILEEYLRASTLAELPVKVALVGPDRISQRFEHESSHGIYDGLDEFTADVVSIQREMISQVVEAGCRYVQIDEPGYTAYVDVPSIEMMRARGEDPDANLARGIAADNDLIRDFPGVTFGVHICRGGGGGRGGARFHREGSYDAIAEQLYGALNFDRFLLEYDSEAAGSLESLRFMPKGKMAVLGLVSNHGEVESSDFIKQQLELASRYVPLEQVALCPRCGFSGHRDEETVWAKFRVQQSVAAEIWGD